jgi:membrane protease YdiL (CAAX protease family)
MDADLPLTAPALAAVAVQLIFLLLGAILLWRTTLSPAARSRRAETSSPLAAWSLPIPVFLAVAAATMIGGPVGQVIVLQIAVLFGITQHAQPDLFLLLAGGGFQLGLLSSGVAAWRWSRSFARAFDPPILLPVSTFPRASLATVLRLGATTFLIALPGIVVASLIWRFALTQLGWPADTQELVNLLANADSAAVVALLVFLAIIVAPVTEEILFRAGLFRYLRNRTPRWLALILPGLIFGALHTNLAAFIPLVVLGVILALAYERTGSILTPIVAHALFNLNTILLVVAGVPA